MSDEKVKRRQFPNIILSAIESRLGLKRKRPQTESNRAKKPKSKSTEAGSSNSQASSEKLMQQKNCKSKTKIKKQKSDSKTHKNISFSLSQPALSANPTSSRNVLRNWQPPLKIVHYDYDTEKTAQNPWLKDIAPSTDNVCGDDSIENGQISTENKGIDAGKMHAESKTVVCNGNGEKDNSLSQQSTQKYVEKETNETQGEESKHEGSQRDEVKNVEMSCAVQKAGKKPASNSVCLTNSADITAGNKDPDPANIVCEVDGNKCNTPFTKHSDEPYQCPTPTKQTQDENNPILRKDDEDKEQNMIVNVREGSGKNIMNKSDNIILPPNKKLLTVMNKTSDCEEESKMKPGYGSVLRQIQSLTVKFPQYMHSMRTLTGSEENSPLPLDLLLKDPSHSQLTGDMTKEMELIKAQPVSPATAFIKILEQNSGANKCEGKGYMSDDILKAEDERGKNNHSQLMAIDVKQIASIFINEPETECQESSLLINDLPIHNSEVHSDKMIETLTLSPSGAAKVPEICNVGSIELQRYKEHEDVETVTPKVLSDTILNYQCEPPNLATSICDVKHTMLNRTDAANMKTAFQSLEAATAEDYSEESKSPSKSLTAENVNTEERFMKTHEEALNTAPCSIVSTKNDMDKHGTAHNGIRNSFKYPVTHAEPQSVVHPSTSMTKESLPKQEINQSESYLYKLKDIFCKSPTKAMEAPNILENAGENPLTKENRLDTASHGYLLDDDIGLTGSQLLRIEDECQYKFQSREWVGNHASICGVATVADTAVSSPKLAPPNWAQIVQEKRQKLRNIIQDISRLNALLTRVRKEMWPLPQSAASEGILKPSPVAPASKGTGSRWGPRSHNM